MPACALTALVWPAWLLSLQLGTILAKDDVDDLMKELGPQAARTLYIVDEGTWQRNVELPGAMLVPTLDRLSEWGPAMGMATIGCWSFTLGLLPTAVAKEHTTLLVVLALIAILPVMIALAPANVSSSCDDLLQQLNDISFIGDRHHKDRCTHLRKSFQWLNNGQGLGFCCFGVIIDNRKLARVATTLIGTLLSDIHSPSDSL